MLKQALKKATLEYISKLDISFMPLFSRSDSDNLNYLYSQGILDDASLENALETAVITKAKEDYDLIVKSKGRFDRLRPDHVSMPEVFAYAISKGVFSDKELSSISFDHGETPQVYCKTYGRENLLEILRKELLNPKLVPEFFSEEYFDSHPVCDCGY